MVDRFADRHLEAESGEGLGGFVGILADEVGHRDRLATLGDHDRDRRAAFDRGILRRVLTDDHACRDGVVECLLDLAEGERAFGQQPLDLGAG
jgi:hypothetical protein